MSILVKLSANNEIAKSPDVGENSVKAISEATPFRDEKVVSSAYQKISHDEKQFSFWTLLPLTGVFAVMSGRDQWHTNERRVLNDFLFRASSAPAGESAFYKLQYVIQLLNIADDSMARAVILKNRGDKRFVRHFSRIAGMVARAGAEAVASYGELEEVRLNASSGVERLTDWSTKMLDVKVRWLVFLSNVTSEKYFFDAAKSSMLELFERLANSDSPADKELLKLYIYFAGASFEEATLRKFAEKFEIPAHLAKNTGVFIAAPMPPMQAYESDTYKSLTPTSGEITKLVRAALLKDVVIFSREMSHLKRGLNEVARDMLIRMKKR